ncbi:uncharacterized protein DS421_15g510190 [Arachis hypogaea]|nr:uncharacterized protein DS421_15g510190 [Arachis hypogaea]
MAEKKKHGVQGEPSTQGLKNSKLTKMDADELKRKLDAIRQQQIIRVTHDMTQKRQRDTTLPSSNTTPQAEDLMSEQDESRKEKSKPSAQQREQMRNQKGLKCSLLLEQVRKGRKLIRKHKMQLKTSKIGKLLVKQMKISKIKQQHQEEATSLKVELGDMKPKQQHQEDELHGLQNMIKLLVQPSEPETRAEEIEALLQNAQHSLIDVNSAHESTHIPNIDMDNSGDVKKD